MPVKRLLNTPKAKYLRQYRENASPTKKARWHADRSERRRQQKIREAELERDQAQTAEDERDVKEKERKAKHAAAQARYMAKKKLQQASNSSQTDNTPNSPAIPDDQETQSIVTPQETPTTKAKQIIIQIESATPNTSGLLSASGIEKQRQRAADKAIVLAATQAVKEKHARKSLFPHLRSSNKKAVSETLQCSRSHFYNVSKKGCNAKLSDETIQEVVNFYKGSDVVTTLPYKTRNGKVLRVMKYTRQRAYNIFMEQHTGVPVSQSTFNRLKPSDIKLMKAAQWVQCVCDICENITSLIRGIVSSMRQSHHDVPDALVGKLSDFCRLTVCNMDSHNCLRRKCRDCRPDQIHLIFVLWLRDDDGGKVTCYRWGHGVEAYCKRSRHMRKHHQSHSRSQAYQELTGMLASYPYHLYNAVNQLCRELHL